jgi:hypothetical protein
MLQSSAALFAPRFCFCVCALMVMAMSVSLSASPAEARRGGPREAAPTRCTALDTTRPTLAHTRGKHSEGGRCRRDAHTVGHASSTRRRLSSGRRSSPRAHRADAADRILAAHTRAGARAHSRADDRCIIPSRASSWCTPVDRLSQRSASARLRAARRALRTAGGRPTLCAICINTSLAADALCTSCCTAWSVVERASARALVE